MKKRSKIAALMVTASLSLLGASQGFAAATATGNLNVSASISALCTVGASTMAFGAYDPTNATNDDATGAVSVTCTNGTTYNIAFNHCWRIIQLNFQATIF